MRIKLLLFFVFSLLLAKAQYYLIGQNSSATHWRQINTEHFQIIYSEEFENKAQYTAYVLSMAYDKATVTLKVKPKKISVILQNDMVEANGFVTLAPRRAEFFTTPPQDDEGLEWLNLLAVHEFRHVVQISKYNQGLTKILYYIFGEQGVGLVLGATTPLWFMEGDAVGFETFATGYGRGRLPEFNMQSRAMLLQLGAFNYDKSSFGSYKTFIPNRYAFGYHMTSYVKEKYGTNTWDSVMNRVAKFPLRPFPFSSALKKYTGKGTSDMYEEMVQYHYEKWGRSMEINKDYYTSFSILNDTVRNTFTSYSFPFETSKGIIAIKKGMADVDQVVMLENGKEKLLHKMGQHDGASFSANANYAVWVEQFPDVRWEYRSFSDIVLFDVANNKRTRFTTKQRLFSPNISADNKLVAVSVDKGNIPSLKFFKIEADTAYLTKQFAEMSMIYFPVWGDNNEVYFVAKKDGYQHIFKWDYKLDLLEPIVVSVPFVMTHLVYKNQKLIFHSTQGGIDNIFELDLSTKEIHQFTVSKFGAFNPSISSKGTLLYADYSAKGLNIVEAEIKVDTSGSRPFFVSQGLLMYSDALRNEQKISVDEKERPQYESKKYYTHAHLFNLHSWAPLSISAESRTANLGASLMSQNKLSNTVLSYNYGFNPQLYSKSHQVKLDYLFWFPKFSFFAMSSVTDNVPVLGDDGYEFFQLVQQYVGASTTLDFNFTRGYFSRYLSLSTRYSINNISRSDGVEANLNSMDYILTYYSAAKRAKRDLQPRWSLNLNAYVHQTLMPSAYYNNSMYGAAKVTTPGIVKHHALLLNAEWQHSDVSGLLPSSNVDLPRGYIGIRYNTITSAKADYTFPLCYPDVRLGALFYMQRIRMGVHYDYAQLLDEENIFRVLQSAGAELRADLNLLRYSFLMDIGCRVSAFQNEGATYLYPQLLFNVGFN